jgi:hypothetical protein
MFSNGISIKIESAGCAPAFLKTIQKGTVTIAPASRVALAPTQIARGLIRCPAALAVELACMTIQTEIRLRKATTQGARVTTSIFPIHFIAYPLNPICMRTLFACAIPMTFCCSDSMCNIIAPF